MLTIYSFIFFGCSQFIKESSFKPYLTLWKVQFICLTSFHYWLMKDNRGRPGGRRGRSYLPKLSHFSLFQAQGEVVLHRIYRKNIPKDYRFSSKLQKMVKTSPHFKIVGLPLCLMKYYLTFDNEAMARMETSCMGWSLLARLIWSGSMTQTSPRL